MSFEAGAPARKVVLITGAGSGMGQACAQRLAASGWRVFGGARHPFVPGGSVEWVSLDVDHDASVQEAVSDVLTEAGRLDAVINCAGFLLCGAVEDTTIEETKALFETNFFGVLRVCRATLPALRFREGHIVKISGIAGVVGLPFAAHYSASKFAVEGLSESLRLEARPFGVKVVLVEPSYIPTNLMAKRRVAAAAGTGAYVSAFERLMHKSEAMQATAPSPECVAALIQRILDNSDPECRYRVGSWERCMLPLLKRFLPQRLFETMWLRALGF